MLDGHNTTVFLRGWLQEYIKLILPSLKLHIKDRNIISQIKRLPAQIEVDDEGMLEAHGGDFAMRLLQYGSAELQVPRVGIIELLRKAVEDQIHDDLRDLKIK